MYDHQTESLWSQLLEKAIAGRLVSTGLEKIPSERISWQTLKKTYPHARVLSAQTGFRRNYAVDPYEGYNRSFGLWFPVGRVRKDLSPKERIMGVELNGRAKAFPISRLQAHSGTLTDKIGDTLIMIRVSETGEILWVKDEQGTDLGVIFSFWFAWQAFHPDTTVY